MHLAECDSHSSAVNGGPERRRFPAPDPERPATAAIRDIERIEKYDRRRVERQREVAANRVRSREAREKREAAAIREESVRKAVKRGVR